MTDDVDADFLDELVAEAEGADPGFAEAYAAAQRRREFLNSLGARRNLAGLTQAVVARKMGTSQSAVARLERGEVDPHLSTLDRYALAIGQLVNWTIGYPGSVTTVPTAAMFVGNYIGPIQGLLPEFNLPAVDFPIWNPVSGPTWNSFINTVEGSGLIAVGHGSLPQQAAEPAAPYNTLTGEASSSIDSGRVKGERTNLQPVKPPGKLKLAA